MKKIVPGGYYSYDAAGKKIWLDYSYYGVGLENIDRIRNLSKNLDLYSSSGAGKPITVSNGCITHSYQGTEADTDKIQVTLKTPITNSLTELEAVDGVVTLSTDGKVLVLPTEDAAILPSYNDRVLDPNRLTIAESPFGGLKGSGSPDYAPGTLYTPTDGIYLTDTSGTNSTKTLTAGKLKELSLLTVDTTGHTITEEFIIANTATSNSPSVIDDCSSTTGWVAGYGTGSDGTGSPVISVENGKIKVVGMSDVNGKLTINKAITSLNLSSYQFNSFIFNSSVAGNVRYSIKSDASHTITWENVSRVSVLANTDTRIVLPINAPAGTTGQLPNIRDAGVNIASITLIFVGITIPPNTVCTFYVSDISADTAKSAYLELQTPDNLADSSLQLQVFDGSAYQTTGTYKLDSTYSAVGTPTSAKWKLADGTKFDDVYGSGLGRALFPKGAAEETKAGSSGSITYSANKGTSKRIGFRVDLPPSDGGRTNFNKCRMKAILSYTDTVGNVVPDLSGNNNTGTIVGGVTKLNDGGLRFDGSTGYVNSLIQSISMSNGYSICANIMPNTTAQYNVILSKDNAYTIKRIFQLRLNNLALELIRFNTSNVVIETVVSNIALSNNVFYKVIAVFDPEIGTKLYIDGILRGSSSNTVLNADIVNTVLYTGVRINSSNIITDFLSGTVSDLRLYSRPLLSTEITTYNNNQSIDPTGLVLHYNPTVSNMGSTTHQFADSTNTSYGLQNLSLPWIALYDPANSLIDFYLFTHRPQSLSFKKDETGTIYSLSLYPGTGSIYHGQIPFSDLTLDTNSDTIPDCLEAAVNGSVTKFLENYTMVI